MLNFKDFTSFMSGYCIYVLGILLVFCMLSLTFRLVLNNIRRIKNSNIYVYVEDTVDSFGNHQPLKKYINYKNKKYYIGQDLKLYSRFNRYYVIIGNKRVYINY